MSEYEAGCSTGMPPDDRIWVNNDDAFEFEVHRFVADASALGLKPGEWPRQLETTMGNKQPFLMMTRKLPEYVIYAQANGCIRLTVYND